MKELVTISHGGLFADSRQVAKVLGIEHDSILKLLREHGEELCFSTTDFKSEMVNRKQGGGTARQWALLSERQSLILITFVRNSEEAVKAKIALVDAFLKMESALMDRRVRSELTDAIQQAKALGYIDMHGHEYGNLTDLVYRTVLGMSAKKYREANELPFDANVRNHLTADQLLRVEQYEKIVASMIAAGYEYATIKAMLEKRAKKVLLTEPQIQLCKKAAINA